jgi:hypothetical protein
MPSKFSSPKPRPSISTWQPAHAGLFVCISKRSRVETFGAGAGGAGTFAGGSGRSWHSMRVRTHLPRLIGEPNCGFANDDMNAPWVSTPARCSGSSAVIANVESLSGPSAAPYSSASEAFKNEYGAVNSVESLASPSQST